MRSLPTLQRWIDIARFLLPPPGVAAAVVSREPATRRPYRLALIALFGVVLALTACAGMSSTEGVLTCPADHTPVVDWAKHEALGCNPAKGNTITPGSDCSAFPARARTTDATGATYECSAAQGKLVWLAAKYPEPTEEPDTRCQHVGDFARAPDGSLMRCVWNNPDLMAGHGPGADHGD
jgi:hypothetical protein